MSPTLKPNLLGVPFSNGFAAASVVAHGLTYFFTHIKDTTNNALAALDVILVPTLASTPSLISHKHRRPSLTSTAAHTGASISPPYALLAFILALNCFFIGGLFIQKQFFLGEPPFGPPIGPPDPPTPEEDPHNTPNNRQGDRHGENGGPPPPPPPFLDTDCNPPKRPRNFFWILFCVLAMLFVILWKQLYLRARSAPRAALKRPSLRLSELHREPLAFCSTRNLSGIAPLRPQISHSDSSVALPLQPIFQSHLKLSAVLPQPPLLQLELKQSFFKPKALAPRNVIPPSSTIEPLLKLRPLPDVKPLNLNVSLPPPRKVIPPSSKIEPLLKLRPLPDIKPLNLNVPLPLPLPLQMSRWQPPPSQSTSPFSRTFSLQPLPCIPPPWLATLKRIEVFWSNVFSRADTSELTCLMLKVIFILLPDEVEFEGWFIWWVTETIAVPILSGFIDGRYRPSSAFWAYYHWIIIFSALSPMLLVVLEPFGSLAKDLADWYFTP